MMRSVALRAILRSPAKCAYAQAPVRWMASATTVQDTAGNVGAQGAEAWSGAKPYSEVPGPRGPAALFAIGMTLRYLQRIGGFHTPTITEDNYKLKETYGPIVRLTVPGKSELVFIFDADEIEHLYRNEGVWPVRQGSECLIYYYKHHRKQFPPSINTLQGKEWQEFRSAVNQVMMQPRNTKQYVEPIDQVTQEFIDRMREIRGKDNRMPLEFNFEISKWALESTIYVALDTRLGAIRNSDPHSEAAQMIESVQTVFASMFNLELMPFALWKMIPTITYKKFVKSMDQFTQIAANYVNLAMDRLKSTTPGERDNRHYSVLENLLLKTEDPGRAVTMALDLVLGGVDTTGTVVGTVMYLLATHPEKQNRLQEELDRVITDPSKSVTKEHLAEMRYMRACIKEAMRMMPIVLGNSRTTTKDMVIGGYQIPKGTTVFTTNNILSENEEYFPRAKEFIPERWLPEGETLKCKHPFSYLPFGFGPRMCVGKRFADLEIEIMVAKAFRNFTFEWDQPPPAFKFFLLYRFTDPLTFIVKDRF